MKDADIRPILKATVLKDYISDPLTRIIEEMDLAASGARVDIAVLNGCIHGYEIKSASDTLKRLEQQIVAYSKVFDRLTIVTEPKYIEGVLAVAPDWIEVIECIEGESNILIKRIGDLNTNQNGFNLAQLLWREELEKLLQIHCIHYNRKLTKWKLSELLGSRVPVEILSNNVRELLKSREFWRRKPA
jgi:hypothetical protein